MEMYLTDTIYLFRSAHIVVASLVSLRLSSLLLFLLVLARLSALMLPPFVIVVRFACNRVDILIPMRH